MVLFGRDWEAHLDELGRGHAVFGVFERGGTVVNFGTTDWVHGLGADSVVDTITTNVLHRLGGDG